MKIRDVMNVSVAACGPDTDLGAAARLMWERDCGVLPVVDESGQVIGMITDRDICIASATRVRTPGEIAAREMLAAPVRVCRPDDDVHDALQTMRTHALRRLPVVDDGGRLAGIVSVSDFIRRTSPGASADGLPAEAVLDTLRAICAPSAGPSGRMGGIPEAPRRRVTKGRPARTEAV